MRKDREIEFRIMLVPELLIAFLILLIGLIVVIFLSPNEGTSLFYELGVVALSSGIVGIISVVFVGRLVDTIEDKIDLFTMKTAASENISKADMRLQYLFYHTLNSDGSKVWKCAKYSWVSKDGDLFARAVTNIIDEGNTNTYEGILIKQRGRIIVISGAINSGESATVNVFLSPRQSRQYFGLVMNQTWSNQNAYGAAILSEDEIVPAQQDHCVGSAEFKQLEDRWSQITHANGVINNITFAALS